MSNEPMSTTVRAPVRVIIALVALLSAAAGSSQTQPETINIPLSRPGEPVTLQIDILSARIEVIGEDRKDAAFSIVNSGGERKMVTPSGVKTVTGGGHALQVSEHDNNISVESEALSGSVAITARIPRRANLELSTVNDGEIKVRDITGNLQLENVNGPISATRITGSVIAESVNQAITVSFAGISASGATALSSLNGDINLSLPAKAGVELRIDTARGQIDSEFEMDVKPSKPVIERKVGSDGVSVRVEDVIVTTINGGGPVIRVKTLNGNIRIGKAAN